jgi:hypothetical protein
MKSSIIGRKHLDALNILPADLERLKKALEGYTREERRALFNILRREFPVHALEVRLGASAEVILEAIDRSSDLTLRGVRGVIAEAAFKEHVVVPLLARGWREEAIAGDSAFDFRLVSEGTSVTIQVKMQRQKNQRPMGAREASKRLFPDATGMWVVETQRTRGGVDTNGLSTRPYRFGAFDILAVSMHPSSGDWSTFRYTLGRWLIPSPTDSSRIFKYQPVSPLPNDDWTDNLPQAIDWFRNEAQIKEIRRSL